MNPLTRAPEADRILVVRLGALGDVVRSFPAVAALRALYPAAHISWLVEPGAAGAVASQAGVDEVLVFPRGELEQSLLRVRLGSLLGGVAQVVRELRRRRFDLVLDFHAILKSGLLSRLSGAPLRVSYGAPFGRELSWLFANRRAELGSRRISRFERNAALVEFLAGAPQPSPAGPLIQPGREAVRRMREALGPGARPVVIHPGTSPGTAHKRYTKEGYVVLARALARQPGLECLVGSGPGREEREQAAAVLAACGDSARPAPSTPEFEDLAALYAQCRLFVGSDSGPLHVASLVGTPVVQLMGPSDPVENEPFGGTPWRRLRVPMPCSPCRRGCAAATCMRVIPSQALVAEVRSLLAETDAGGAGGAAFGAACL